MGLSGGTPAAPGALVTPCSSWGYVSKAAWSLHGQVQAADLCLGWPTQTTDLGGNVADG